MNGLRQPAKVASTSESSSAGSAFDNLLRNTNTNTGTETNKPSSDVNTTVPGSTAAVLTRREIDDATTDSTNEGPEVATEPRTQSSTEDAASESRELPEKSEPVIDRELIERLRRQLHDMPSEADKSPSTTSEDAVSDEDSVTNGQRATDDTKDGAESFRRSGNADAPIKFSMTPDGKLIASSRDITALAELEALMSQVAAPRRSYKVFRLKYATPSWVTLNLKDFFKSEEQTKSGLEYDPWWGIVPSQKKTSGKHSLSKRRQPQFISDNFTSTILVRDADAKQLQTIEDLIEIYDIPEPSDSRSMRVTTIFRLKHAKAGNVAAAVKDVFRDLLSSNDKALEKDDKGQRQASSGLVTFLPRGPSKDGGDSGEDDPIRFKGLLSIGIDDSSNTLIVSSSGTLMDTIGEMIESLDAAADSSSVVQVLHVEGTVDLALIQERLKDLMKVTPAADQPGQQPPRNPGQQPPLGTPPRENSAEAGGN